MSVFLFVAIVTLALYEAVTLALRAWPHISVSRYGAFVGIVTGLAIVAFVLAGIAIYSTFYHPYGFQFFITDVLFGTLFARIVLGVAFGVISGVLLNALLIGPPGKLSLGGKIIVGLAFATLILGVGGEQLVQNLARRVSKLSFGGAEVAFVDTAQVRRIRPEGDTSSALFGTPTATGAPISLDIFKILPGMIERDKLYIKLVSKDPAKTKKVEDGLNRAAAFATTMLAVPVGECLSEIYNQTSDSDLIGAALRGLLPPLRKLASQAAYHNTARLAQDGADAFVGLWKELFTYAYDNAYSHTLKGQPLQKSNADLGPRRLAIACASVAFALCSDLGWQEKLNKITDVADLKERDDFDDEKLRSCYDRALPNAVADDDKWKNLKEQIKIQFRTFADEKDLHSRPYAAIILATIAAHLGRPETAIAHLENWIQAQQDRSPETTWLRIRAQLILIHLADYWIRREGPNASIVLRDYYLARVDKVLT